VQARETAQPVAPLSVRHPDLNVADAYAIQDLNIRRRLTGSANVVGRKVGLTSRPM
jgi:2-keto-4-pentenoate hydratase